MLEKFKTKLLPVWSNVVLRSTNLSFHVRIPQRWEPSCKLNYSFMISLWSAVTIKYSLSQLSIAQAVNLIVIFLWGGSQILLSKNVFFPATLWPPNKFCPMHLLFLLVSNGILENHLFIFKLLLFNRDNLFPSLNDDLVKFDRHSSS